MTGALITPCAKYCTVINSVGTHCNIISHKEIILYSERRSIYFHMISTMY